MSDGDHEDVRVDVNSARGEVHLALVARGRRLSVPLSPVDAYQLGQQLARQAFRDMTVEQQERIVSSTTLQMLATLADRDAPPPDG